MERLFQERRFPSVAVIWQGFLVAAVLEAEDPQPATEAAGNKNLEIRLQNLSYHAW